MGLLSLFHFELALSLQLGRWPDRHREASLDGTLDVYQYPPFSCNKPTYLSHFTSSGSIVTLDAYIRVFCASLPIPQAEYQHMTHRRQNKHPDARAVALHVSPGDCLYPCMAITTNVGFQTAVAFDAPPIGKKCGVLTDVKMSAAYHIGGTVSVQLIGQTSRWVFWLKTSSYLNPLIEKNAHLAMEGTFLEVDQFIYCSVEYWFTSINHPWMGKNFM